MVVKHQEGSILALSCFTSVRKLSHSLDLLTAVPRRFLQNFRKEQKRPILKGAVSVKKIINSLWDNLYFDVGYLRLNGFEKHCLFITNETPWLFLAIHKSFFSYPLAF